MAQKLDILDFACYCKTVESRLRNRLKTGKGERKMEMFCFQAKCGRCSILDSQIHGRFCVEATNQEEAESKALVKAQEKHRSLSQESFFSCSSTTISMCIDPKYDTESYR